MAGFQIETGTATGRGFSGVDADGYLAKFYAWVTNAYAAGGPLWYIHDDQSALGTDPYIVITDTNSPSVNDYNTAPNGGAPKFLKVGMVTATAGQVYAAGYLWWDNATQAGYGLWFRYYVNTYDDADFAYDFRGGEETMALFTRLGSSWDHIVVDDFVGDTNLLEAATTVGTVQSGVTAGSSVVLQLDTGEAANFTADKRYYMFDFDGHTWCDYVTVESVNAGVDQITVDSLSEDFPAGAVISSYAHRYHARSNGDANGNGWSEEESVIPYFSYRSYEMVNQAGGKLYGWAPYDYVDEVIERGDPEDEGFYYCMRPLIYERYNTSTYYNTAYMNRTYGVAKNIYVSSQTGLATMLDYRTINSKDYLYFSAYSTDALLILNTEATS